MAYSGRLKFTMAYPMLCQGLFWGVWNVEKVKVALEPVVKDGSLQHFLGEIFAVPSPSVSPLAPAWESWAGLRPGARRPWTAVIGRPGRAAPHRHGPRCFRQWAHRYQQCLSLNGYGMENGCDLRKINLHKLQNLLKIAEWKRQISQGWNGRSAHRNGL